MASDKEFFGRSDGEFVCIVFSVFDCLQTLICDILEPNKLLPILKDSHKKKLSRT
jgi:hypothetical protein